MSFSIYTIPDVPEDEPRREAAVVRSGALDIAGSADLDAITAEARRQLRTTMAIVTIIYQDWAYVIAASGYEPGIYRRSTSFCAHAILSPDEPFVVPDAAADERFAGNPNVEEDDGIRFYAAVALKDDRGSPLGTLCVLDTRPRPALTEAEAKCLRFLSGVVMDRLTAQAGRAGGPRRAPCAMPGVS